MKIVQKIETGGTSKTGTPILKFLINELFVPTDARHITHWARLDSAARKMPNAAIATIRLRRTILMRHLFRAFLNFMSRTLIAQILRAETVRKENQQQADA